VSAALQPAAALQPSEVRLLEYLAQVSGTDIWGFGDAVDGRKLEQVGLVIITEAQRKPKNGAERQPYYGIMISDAGRDWLAKSGLYQRGLPLL